MHKTSKAFRRVIILFVKRIKSEKHFVLQCCSIRTSITYYFIAAYIYFCSSSIYQFVLCPIDGRNLYSAGYILEVAGIPYSTTQSIEEALDGSGMILFSSPVKKHVYGRRVGATHSMGDGWRCDCVPDLYSSL